MSLKIDHVTIAGQALGNLEKVFAGAGFKADYGGPHSNGVTHMSLIPFDDGSYLELISLLDPGGSPSPLWHDQIMSDAGLCAWAVEVPDAVAEAERLRALGISVDGPRPMHRVRPDGVTAEWDIAFVGQDPPGAVLPFLIRNRTPREHRVNLAPAGSRPGGRRKSTGRLTGIGTVVLGVHNLDESISLFRRVFGWQAPELQTDAAFGARLAHFTGSPVVLATPAGNASWLDIRLASGDDAPCACLLAAPQFHREASRYRLYGHTNWFGREVAWFEPARLGGLRLGIVG